jgi:hypothetical protein
MTAIVRPALIAGCLILQIGCGWQSDAATRFADCVEGVVKAPPRDGSAARAGCDLGMPGSYVVVLHPEGALREQEVVSAGFPQALLPELRGLRLGQNPAIYVIATGPDVSGLGSERSTRSSWTTAQMHFVQIDTLMVLARNGQPVSIDVGGPPERRVIEAIY